MKYAAFLAAAGLAAGMLAAAVDQAQAVTSVGAPVDAWEDQTSDRYAFRLKSGVTNNHYVGFYESGEPTLNDAATRTNGSIGVTGGATYDFSWSLDASGLATSTINGSTISYGDGPAITSIDGIQLLLRYKEDAAISVKDLTFTTDGGTSAAFTLTGCAAGTKCLYTIGGLNPTTTLTIMGTLETTGSGFPGAGGSESIGFTAIASVAPVPLPAGAVLIGTALLGAGAVRRLSRKAA